MKSKKRRTRTHITANSPAVREVQETKEVLLDAASLSAPIRIQPVAPTFRIFYDSNGVFFQSEQSYRQLDANELQDLRSMDEAGEIILDEQPLPERAVEANWYFENLLHISEQYPARDWLCIIGRKVISHAPRLADAIAEARTKGHPDPFVARVPRRRPGTMAVIA